jgi:hypothetical protein
MATVQEELVLCDMGILHKELKQVNMLKKRSNSIHSLNPIYKGKTDQLWE